LQTILKRFGKVRNFFRGVEVDVTNPWDFPRLLRLDRHCNSKQHRCNQEK
jgi:hypothetical protein